MPRHTEPSIPDRPCAIGSIAFLLIRSEDTRAVADTLGMRDAHPCNWHTAQRLTAKWGEAAWVSPPVKGWTLVAGATPFGAQDFADRDPLLAKLREWSRTFGEVQFYSEDNGCPWAMWAVCRGGEVERAYAFVTDPADVVLWNVGPTTEAERAQGYLYGDTGHQGPVPPQEYNKWLPCEETTAALARAWGIDPTELGADDAPPGMGLSGTIRAPWQVPWPSTAFPGDSGPPAPREDDDSNVREVTISEEDRAKVRRAFFGDTDPSDTLRMMQQLLGAGPVPLSPAPDADGAIDFSQVPIPDIDQVEKLVAGIDPAKLLEYYSAEKGHKIPDRWRAVPPTGARQTLEALAEISAAALPIALPPQILLLNAVMILKAALTQYRGVPGFLRS